MSTLHKGQFVSRRDHRRRDDIKAGKIRWRRGLKQMTRLRFGMKKTKFKMKKTLQKGNRLDVNIRL